MNKTQQRQIALSAARSQARRNNWDVKTLTSKDALLILDDMLRSEPDLIACTWYRNASDSQVTLFCKEWDRQKI